jgi:hypothetical protein
MLFYFYYGGSGKYVLFYACGDGGNGKYVLFYACGGSGKYVLFYVYGGGGRYMTLYFLLLLFTGIIYYKVF